jgi:UDP-N-acetylglucosamine 2-epimerase
MEILLVVGTRPQIVKSVPVIREAKKAEIARLIDRDH